MSIDRPLMIAPSILAADFSALGQACRDISDAGADWVHVDVMDGHFVPNLTFGPGMCAALRPHIAGVMDVHLMVEPADSWIDLFSKTGTDVLTVHLETGPHIHKTLQAIRATGIKSGLAINPGTGIDAVSHLIDMVDVICVMGVNPGFGGQAFLMPQLDKLRALRSLIGDRPVHLQVDGGVTRETAPMARAAGADVLVAGSAIFTNGPSAYAANIAALRASAEPE